jgi:LAO/AO transport system kinase
MQDHEPDPDVYVRSMATRGQLGGLASATPRFVRCSMRGLRPRARGDGRGRPVGGGGRGAADTTVVVVTPGWGDSVQASKAGLLEVGDVFVVNKADRDGTAATVRDLEAMLATEGAQGGDRRARHRGH